MSNLNDSILRWLLESPDVGASAKCIASVMVGMRHNGYHPLDPADFNRCLLLLAQVPAIRGRLSEMRNVSSQWAKLIDRWRDIETVFLDEAGLNWTKGNRAPKTYAMMKKILD